MWTSGCILIVAAAGELVKLSRLNDPAALIGLEQVSSFFTRVTLCDCSLQLLPLSVCVSTSIFEQLFSWASLRKRGSCTCTLDWTEGFAVWLARLEVALGARGEATRVHRSILVVPLRMAARVAQARPSGAGRANVSRWPIANLRASLTLQTVCAGRHTQRQRLKTALATPRLAGERRATRRRTRWKCCPLLALLLAPAARRFCLCAR